jgi:hypothetical protein
MTENAESLVRNGQDELFQRKFMAQLEPVKRLMLAVLECAANDFRTYATVPTGRGRRLFTEVDAWFRSSTDGPFDFETICQATDLDPDFIRKGLRSSYAAGCRQPSISVAPKAKIAAPSARYPRPRERFRRGGAFARRLQASTRDIRRVAQ